MTETLLRMIEVGSISNFLYRRTYLTIILCKVDKRRTSRLWSFLWEHEAKTPYCNAKICENFPLVGLWLKASQTFDDYHILKSVLIFRFLVFLCLLDLIILVLPALKWDVIFPFDTNRVMFKILVLHPSIAIRCQLS